MMMRRLVTMLCRKTNRQTSTEVSVTATQKNPSTVALSTRNPAYNLPELDQYVYDFIDDTDNYDEPNFYEPLADDPDGNPQVQVASPGYDVIGPDYLKIIG